VGARIEALGLAFAGVDFGKMERDLRACADTLE